MKLNDCYVIGITGGIATGKSTITKMIVDRGYIVIDADKIAKQVVDPGQPAYNDIVETFGTNILLDDNSINRKKLGRLIFSSKSIRNIVNDIIHPRVFEHIATSSLEKCKDNKLIFIDIPLLFEVFDKLGEYNVEFDEIWLVYTDLETQLKRLMERDQISEEEAMNRISAQMNLDEKKKKSHKIIFNNGNMVELRENLDRLLKEI